MGRRGLMPVEEREDVPQTEEFEEEESPFRRRPKVVEVRRRRWHRVRRYITWVFGGALGLILLGYGGFRAARFAGTSPRFELSSAEDIVVEGNRFVTRDEVLNALGLPLGRKFRIGVNLFRLPLEEKRKQVESIVWVHSAVLLRSYPHRLTVHVVEREPVAFLKVGERVRLVDAEGVVMDKPEKAAFTFPVLAGIDGTGSAAERRPRLALFQDFMGQVADATSAAGWLVSEVDLADAEDLKALLVQGQETLQVHFGHQDFSDRFHDFLTLLPEMRKTEPKIESVDLRFRNQIVVNPKAGRALAPGH